MNVMQILRRGRVLSVVLSMAAFGLSAAELAPGGLRVVIAREASPVVRFAADELTNALFRTFGSPVPLSASPSAEKANLILGSNEWSRAAGLDSRTVARDGFLICVRGDNVYLLGTDDARVDPRATFTGRVQLMSGFERGTLNAVYAFLERYAETRFFFPGDLGTCFARKDRIVIPDGTEKTEPVFTERYFSHWGFHAGSWPDKSVSVQRLVAEDWLRLRFASTRLICSHGQRFFRYVPRFAKEHPDWFCLRKDGTRNLTDMGERSDTGKDLTYLNTKLCYSSPICEEIYQDVKAYLTGQPASVRGLDRWGPNCVGGKYVDIMPEDGYQECFCPKCQAAYDKGKKAYASDLMWKLTSDIARRLTQEGVKGDLTQMAYYPYDQVPSFPLPGNIQVMVAVNGPWSAAMPESVDEQVARAKAWSERLGHKVWLWTYPGKYFGEISGVPEIGPRGYAHFFSRAADYIFGAYACIETDRLAFELLNLYAFAKICWNPRLDIGELLDDWHTRLFGPAKAEMKAVFDLLERKWLYGVCRRPPAVSALGPVTLRPSEGQIWGDIYTAETVAVLEDHFRKAASKVRAGSLEARRIAFFRDEFLGSLARAARQADPASALARRKSENGPSLIANGDFDSADGWSKSVPWGTTVLDTADKVTGRASARISSDTVPHRERNVQGDFCTPVSLTKGVRYRLSYFIKTKDVIPYDTRNGAGLCLWMAGAFYLKHPMPLFQGTCSWVYQSHDFVAPVDAPNGKLQFRLEDSLGTMWIDGVRLERLDEK